MRRLSRGSPVWTATRQLAANRRRAHASLAYWGDYPQEVDAFIDRARAEAAQARAGWERQQELLGR